MERPKPNPPLDVTPFTDLIDAEFYGHVHGSVFNHIGESTSGVLLLFGPDDEEIREYNERLLAATLPDPGPSLN
jgi:hypothetical protein